MIDISRLQFDEKKHAYKLDGRLMTGVTSVIDGTSSKANLIGWAANMAVDYIQDSGIFKAYPDRLAVWAGHDELEKTLKDARTAHTRKKDKAANKGTDTHALVEEYINLMLRDQDGHALLMNETTAITPFIEWAYDNKVRFLAAEQRLYSETHGYAGTCDFIAIIDGKLTIGDLKTFPKMWSADAFIQMGAYSLAYREMTGSKAVQSVVVKMCDPKDERLKKYGGSAFSVYPRYALEEDEDMFLTRLKVYRYNQNFVSPKD